MLERGRGGYELKPGALSSHGRILGIAEAWPRRFRILEVGTASGYLGRELGARGFTELVGIEHDPQLAQDARPYYQVVHLTDLEYDDHLSRLGQFDVLICADVLEHTREPLEQLRRLSGVVRPSGQFVISLPNAVNWTVRLMVLSGRFEYAERGLLDRGHLRFFTFRTARRLVEESGLRIRRLYVTPLPIGYVFRGSRFHRLAELIERLYYALAVCWKTLFAYQFVFVAEPDAAPSKLRQGPPVARRVATAADS